MNWLRFGLLFVGALICTMMFTQKRRIKDALKPSPEKKEATTEETIKAANAPQNLDDMIAAVKFTDNPVGRHILLSRIVRRAYQERSQDKFQKILLEYGRRYIEEFPEMHPALEEKYAGDIPKIDVFKWLAIGLEESGKYDEAVKICEIAVAYSLEDDTKSGFRGRIARLEKKKKGK